MRVVVFDDGFEGVVVVGAFGVELTVVSAGGEASGGVTSLMVEVVVGVLWVVDAGREVAGRSITSVGVR